MAEHIKLALVSIAVALFLTLASSAVVPGWVISAVDASPSEMNMIANPGAGGGSAS